MLSTPQSSIFMPVNLLDRVIVPFPRTDKSPIKQTWPCTINVVILQAHRVPVAPPVPHSSCTLQEWQLFTNDTIMVPIKLLRYLSVPRSSALAWKLATPLLRVGYVLPPACVPAVFPPLYPSTEPGQSHLGNYVAIGIQGSFRMQMTSLRQLQNAPDATNVPSTATSTPLNRLQAAMFP
ncbi:hypothetical protein DL93DRAFT_2162303 [Clavulina sp. PMI_390]|nr:hypothetical protein DL93DRAFT_2162303 [Clavulina sp. PMI_390]